MTLGASIHFDHTDPVVEVDVRSVFRRQALDAPQDTLRRFARCRQWPAALRARPLMPEIDRIDADFGEAPADEIADRKSLFPLQRIARVTLGAALVARLDEIGRRRALAEVVALVGFGRQVFHELDLED